MSAPASVTLKQPKNGTQLLEPSNEHVQVYELRLDQDGSPHKDTSYVRLPPPVQPYVLRFSIDAGSLASKEASLWSNFPKPGHEFHRSLFVQRRFPTDLNKSNHVDLVVSQAGVFEFYVEYTTESDHFNLFHKSSSQQERKQAKHGYFNVDPILHAPIRKPILSADFKILSKQQGGGQVLSQQQPLSLDAIVLQTMIAKWAGPISEWNPHLDCARDAGYNMIHFPPLNVRGASNSPYSIADQTDFSHDLFGSHVTTKQGRLDFLRKTLSEIKTKSGILSMSDVVWNHTANNSPWLYQHPDAAYSPFNSPHLTPADELERGLMEFNANLAKLSLTSDPKTEADVAAIIQGVKDHVIAPLNLWQYYVLDTHTQKQAFQAAWSNRTASSNSSPASAALSIRDAARLVEEQALQNRMSLSSRYVTTLNMDVIVSLFSRWYPNLDEAELLNAFGNVIDQVNAPLYTVYNDDVKAIIDNLASRLQYTRIDPNGPKLGAITPQTPFFEPYFTRLDPTHPSCKGRDAKELTLANNGWIWAANPLQDFASSESRVYLRREVIVWCDCVKLRYGAKPQDSPFLWKHMEEYTKILASSFDAFRIDNCHSTPVHIGEYFLDVARRVNPNLYVCAELFTGSAEMDVHFVSRLGINSLIREMENGHDPVEESRLLYRFGVNKPVGSMDQACLSEASFITLPGQNKKLPCSINLLQGSNPHALFMDATHDNETPTSKRTTQDAITMGALVAFSWSAIGSTKGFDDLYPKTLDVVEESRKYQIVPNPEESGIGSIKRLVNHLHVEMVGSGFTEGHVHQENDYIFMHRVHPQTHRGFLCVAHTAFNASSGKDRGEIQSIRLDRTEAHFIVGKSLEILETQVPSDSKVLRGLASRLIDISAPELRIEQNDKGVQFTEIVVPEFFPPGSVMLFSTFMSGIPNDLDQFCSSGADEAMEKLNLVDLNVVLYRTEGEENDITKGSGSVYSIPGQKEGLVYCGLEGWMPALHQVMQFNDLGHPLCAHLRQGTWALDYTWKRLESQVDLFPNLALPAQWLQERFDLVKATVPNFLRPKYFALLVNTAYKSARRRAISQMSGFVHEGHDFTKALALCSVQLNGLVKSASLWPDKDVASMAAGLPFFSASWARLWGRDVFISLRGLYLATGMYDAAREHILAFGSTLKHGLIPNLLDSGKTPRYNCRDGPWFFAQNVQDYTKMVPNGRSILDEKVKRRFPLNDEWVPFDDPKAFSHSSTVAQLIQEILQRHASGIHFREYNAGPSIDGDMHPEGFNIDIQVDWETGLVFGGNRHNCGTWQDKNGSSSKAGNKGVPGSPRDGAAIEITALLKSTLSWIESLREEGTWKVARGVEAVIGGKKRIVTYNEWADLIQKSFEQAYFIPVEKEQDSKYKIDSNLVNRRGIYKDVFGSSQGREWADYQFRSNFPIAMCVAPELFKGQHACIALNQAREILVGPLGMKTLDPSDWNYRPNYDQADTQDPLTSCGWNYHNGPEWVWLRGYYLRAVYIFGVQAGISKAEMNHRINALLLEHRKHIRSSVWAGLPELTNADGEYCKDSCQTQAWSASTLLEVLELMSSDM